MDAENQIELGKPVPRHPGRQPLAVPSLVDSGESEDGTDLRAYWEVLHKRRWTVFTAFLVVLTLGLIGTLKQKPLYRARVVLEVEKEKPQLLTLQELFELDTVSDTYLQTQYKMLESESLARRVIERLRLDTLEEFNPSSSWWSWWNNASKKTVAQAQSLGVVAASSDQDPLAYEITKKHFRNRLRIEPIRRSRLVAVSFESQNPELAARVANTLAASYIEQSLEIRWEAAQKAAEWLSQQLDTMKAKLEKSEEEFLQYGRDHGLLFLESEQGHSENVGHERLRQLQAELTRAQAERFEKESLYRLIQASEAEALPGVFENRLMQDLTVRLAELKREQAQLVTTFTADYPRVKQVQSQMDALEAVRTRERERAVQRITNDYLAAGRREELLREAFHEQRRQADLTAEKSVQYNILKREVETNKELYEGLLQRLKQAGMSTGVKASNIRIADRAEVSEKPVKPRIALNLALAGLLGLGLGVGAASLQEALDNTLKTPEDVERFLHVPSLALIPAVESLNHRSGRKSTLSERWHRIEGNAQPQRLLAETFSCLRTSVLLSTPEHPVRSLLLSSAEPSEGKTTISGNLAISLAQLGQRVLLIDADLRHPCVHEFFDLPRNAGLVDYLTGPQPWQAFVQSSKWAGLDVLVSGPVPPNPAELLSSERMRDLIQMAMADYNFVLLDSPPLLSVADSRVLATLVEGVVLVVQGGSTPRRSIQRAQRLAVEVGATLLGAVLNNVDTRTDDYYYARYYRSPYHGSEDKPAEDT
ncbi:MAG: GumC family protein [Terriglobia bacterium]